MGAHIFADNLERHAIAANHRLELAITVSENVWAIRFFLRMLTFHVVHLVGSILRLGCDLEGYFEASLYNSRHFHFFDAAAVGVNFHKRHDKASRRASMAVAASLGISDCYLWRAALLVAGETRYY